MPKDNQEIERIVEEFETKFSYGGFGGLMPKHRDGGATLMREVKEFFRTTLTTYGNARELAGVEKVEKGVPTKSEPRGAWESGEVMGWNDCRQATLDHIAKIKSELTTRPGQTDMDRPLNFERE